MSNQERPRSQAEWIVPGTEVPADGWTPSCLGKVLSQANRRVQVESTGIYIRLGVRWYAAGPFVKDVAAGSEIRGKHLQSVRSGDFIYNRLFAWKGSFGVVSEEQDGCYVSDEFPVFEVDHSAADARFLWRWFSQPKVWSAIEGWSSGSTRTSRLRFREPDLLNMVVPLPPLPEQRAIARVLRTVQEAIEATERVIEAAKELKRSMMEYLFTYGPVPVDQADQVEQQEARFGQVPVSWSIPALEECATVQTGIAKGRRETSGRTISAPYLRVANVQDGFLDLNEIKSIEIRPGEESRYGLRFGDVLLTEGGDSDKLGRGVIWRDEIPNCVHQNHIFAVRVVGTLLSPDYLGYLVQTRYSKAYFLNVAHRTTHLACINSAKLKALPMPLPSASEQQKIAQYLEKVDGYLEVQIDRAKALGALLSSLLRNLMTGKVRVTPTEQDMEASE